MNWRTHANNLKTPWDSIRVRKFFISLVSNTTVSVVAHRPNLWLIEPQKVKSLEWGRSTWSWDRRTIIEFEQFQLIAFSRVSANLLFEWNILQLPINRIILIVEEGQQIEHKSCSYISRSLVQRICWKLKYGGVIVDSVVRSTFQKQSRNERFYFHW